MDEQEEGYGGSGTGGTGGGGHGGHGHVPRGQPAGIGAGPLYFLVVTTCTIVALAAIWLLYYGVKRCHKMLKNRSQRRVGCFPTEETSCVALNMDCPTNGDVCINMATSTGEEKISIETAISQNERKADHTVVSIFDDEEEFETLPRQKASLDVISNSDERVEMHEEAEQEKEYEEISPRICQRENPEINQNETDGNETCQYEAQSVDVTETAETLQERIQLAQGKSCTILMATIQEDKKEESRTEDEFKKLDNTDLPSTNYESSNEADTDLPSSVTCELEGLQESEQETEDESYGSESSDDELQLFDDPRTVDYYEIIQLQQTIPRTVFMDATKEKTAYANDNNTEDKFEERENGEITGYESSAEASVAPSSSSIAQEFEEDREIDKESTELKETNSEIIMEDNNCEIGMEALLEELESSRTVNYESSNEEDLETDDEVIEDLVRENMEPEKTVFATGKGNGDYEQISKSTPFSALNNKPGPFDDNRNADLTLVYTLTTDAEPPKTRSGQAPRDTVARKSHPPLEISGGTPEIPPSTSEGTRDGPNRHSTPVHQVRCESELADPAGADTSDRPSSAWQKALKMDPNLLEYAQAEGGWMRKKVDNYVPGPTHETTLSNREDVLGFGPGILTTILEPVNRFLAQVISPDESQMLLIEPDQPAQVNTEDFDDRDQEAIRAEMVRLTQPKKPGLVSFLDFCQAEGSPHEHLPRENNNFPETYTVCPIMDASSTPRHHEMKDKRPSTEEELEEIDPVPVTIQANLAGSTTRPQNGRQNVHVGGVPIELNINLNLSCVPQSSCNKCDARGQLKMDAACSCGGPERSSDPVAPDAADAQEFQQMPETKEPGTCPCPRAKDLMMCGEDHPEDRVYGFQSVMDFMQAEGSPCYVHQEESGPGLDLVEIGGQLSSWWDTAVRAMTPNSDAETESSYAETVGGLITITRRKKSCEPKQENSQQKDNDKVSQERNSGLNDSETSARGQKGVGGAADQKARPSKK